MRIVRIIGVLERGGAQLSALRLAVALREHGIESPCLLAGTATAEGIALAEHFGVTAEAFEVVAEISPPASLQWRPSREFADWLQRRLAGADLAHAHMFGAWWAAAAALSGALDGVPLVASEHNEMSWPAGDHTDAAGQAALRVNAFFGHGPAAQAFGQRIGLPTRLIHEGRSAISAPHVPPLPRLPSPRITFAGRLSADKAPDVLVEAVSRMADPPPTYLVGEGPMRAQLLSLARCCGVADVVRMPGWSMTPERWVAGSTVHVVPSREEAWSQSAVMALSLGVPVVGTRVDGLALTLGNERGILVPPNDPNALASALADVLAGRRPVSAPGRRYAAEFTPAAVAARYAGIYQNLVEGNDVQCV